MTVTLTQPYSFSFNGLTFGGAGSPYQILSVDGLEALPELRSQDDNRGYADGMFSGRDFYGGRTVTIIFNTLAANGVSAQTNYNTIQSYLLPQTSGIQPISVITHKQPVWHTRQQLVVFITVHITWSMAAVRLKLQPLLPTMVGLTLTQQLL